MFNLTSKKLFLLLILVLISKFTSAENMKKFDHLEVHYIGLSTAILQPEIASTYGIERSRYMGFINITVLDTSFENNQAISVGISGTATNLVGQQSKLEFTEIKEGKAIYYIAQFKYPNDENFRFNIIINDNGKEHNLKFQQKFYVEQ